MSEKRLLRIILKHTGPAGYADGEAVKAEYGPGFDDVIYALILKDCIDNRCPAGSIMLSETGRYEAKR